MEPDMSQDQNDYRPPTSFADVFGDLLGDVPTFQDQPPEPGPRSSAARHAKRRQANDAAAAQAHRLDLLSADAETYADDQARQRVRDDLTHGRTPSQSDQIRAARAVRRDPTRPRQSSAERHAAQALGRRQYLPIDTDDQARREGRRPRR
jgi:hypothetical protein